MVTPLWLVAPPANFPGSLLRIILMSSTHELVAVRSNFRAFCSLLLQENEYFVLLLLAIVIQGIHRDTGSSPQAGIAFIIWKMPVPEICPAPLRSH